MAQHALRCRVETESHVYARIPSRGNRARWERYSKAQPEGRAYAVYEGLANEDQALWLELATTMLREPLPL